MKPVGPIHPKQVQLLMLWFNYAGKMPPASLFNMVGFQTKLTWPRTAAHLSRLFWAAKTLNLPAMAVSTATLLFTPLPSCSPHCNSTNNENIFFAGQITGVEGYTESAAMGLLAGLNAAFIIEGKKIAVSACRKQLIGALLHYIVSAESTDRLSADEY